MAKPYVTREQLSKEIIISKKRYRESNHPVTPAECFTPDLTKYLKLMVDRYANKGQWRSYSYIDDMKSDALVTLCQNCFKYDETRFDNPFGYLTQIIKYCFITFLEKEEIIRDIKDSLWESIGMTPSYARQLKNEMMRDVGDTSNKGMKALKKDTEALQEKIDIIGKLGSRVNKLRDYDFETELAIAHALEIDPLPFTSSREAAYKLFPNGEPTYEVEIGIEIAGNRVNCLSLVDANTNSRTKRIIPDTAETSVTLALCSIGLTIRRDLMVKRLREISGFNLTPRFPTASAPVGEVNDFVAEATEYLPSDPSKRRRRKTT